MKRKPVPGVLIIDDSALMRRELSRILESPGRLRVVGTAADGEEGLEKARQLDPDVVTVDIKLPGMDGLACLQRIMIESPRPCVMISAYTIGESIETLEALELGAVDFIEKPSGEISRDIETCADQIVRKVLAASGARLSAITRIRPQPVAGAAAPKPGKTGPVGRIVVLGVSTGGPRTLMQIVPQLPADLPAPVLIVQHMPKKFTRGFAERLDQHSALEVREAEQGEPLREGVAYVAPGGRLLSLTKREASVAIQLSEPGREDLYVPSVEQTFSSAIDLFGREVIGVILTGMGDDGADAMARLHGLGGLTIAQSPDSAVIDSMPSAVIERGAARVVAAPPEIAARIAEAARD